MMKMMMRCWTFVVMDKDQNIRSQYDEKNIVNCYPDEIWQPEEVDNEENIEKSIYTQFNINIYTRNILPMLIRCYQQFGRGKR